MKHLKVTKSQSNDLIVTERTHSPLIIKSLRRVVRLCDFKDGVSSNTGCNCLLN